MLLRDHFVSRLLYFTTAGVKCCMAAVKSCPVLHFSVWCTINRFKLPSSINAADRSKVAPLCVPQMFVYVVLYCFGDTFVSFVVFSSTESIFPFASSFYLFYLSPLPGSHVPFPCAF
jgi:hypothetical protein